MVNKRDKAKKLFDLVIKKYQDNLYYFSTLSEEKKEDLNEQWGSELQRYYLFLKTIRKHMQEDVELTLFSDDEIDALVIDEFAKADLETTKSVLERDAEYLIKKTDLKLDTINDVIKFLTLRQSKILKDDFDFLQKRLNEFEYYQNLFN